MPVRNVALILKGMPDNTPAVFTGEAEITNFGKWNDRQDFYECVFQDGLIVRVPTSDRVGAVIVYPEGHVFPKKPQDNEAE